MARKLPPFPPLNAILVQDQKLPLVSGPVTCRPLQDGTTQGRPSWGDQDGVLPGPTCFLSLAAKPEPKAWVKSWHQGRLSGTFIPWLCVILSGCLSEIIPGCRGR